MAVQFTPEIRCGQLTYGEFRMDEVRASNSGCEGAVSFQGRPGGRWTFEIPNPISSFDPVLQKVLPEAEAIVSREVLLREPGQLDQEWSVLVDSSSGGDGLAAYSFVENYFIVFELTIKLRSGGNRPYTIEGSHSARVSRQRWLSDPLYCTQYIDITIYRAAEAQAQTWDEATRVQLRQRFCSDSHDGVVALLLDGAERGQPLDVEVSAAGYPIRRFRIRPNRQDLYTVVDTILPPADL